MKRILICTDGSIFAQSSYQYGAWFARRLGATVKVLYVTDARSRAAVKARNFSGSIGVDASEQLLNKLVSLEYEKAKLDHQQAKLILQDAQAVLMGHGVEEVQSIHETGFLLDCLEQFEPQVDLMVLGKRGQTADFASSHLGANVERIVRSSRHPCLITSRDFQTIERVLLSYDGSSSGQNVLNFLLKSPLFQGLELHIVTVGKGEEDKTAHARLDEAGERARQGGFDPICSLRIGNPETAIAEYVQAQSINLLLMGAYGHSRIRHLIIGSTTVQILRRSTIPVLVFR
ncbi:universal stress protein [Spirulina subsalsa FACHB-351]|uniref:Universal stress protein n=1 Tax=Spirulina subsalsa FACHB-351 TaxID=234711 RepID=A0ABT3L3R3_9CYAN|nr:universal stress protein [Spirulina subsalsa]MCW6036105.1 universal stress protein [Spirulina subsalsa FACHB-351]